MGTIEGTHQVVLTMRFNVPPGQSPEQAGKMIAMNGVCVSTGLLPYLTTMDAQVEEIKPQPPRLERI